jgi:hypothetical protein
MQERLLGPPQLVLDRVRRRGAQRWFALQFQRAIEEMTLTGGRLTAKLLGANPNAAGFIRAA